MADDLGQISLRTDGAEGACMDAVAALDALALVDIADAELVILKSAHRAGTLTGADQMRDRAVRAGICAHTALFALGRIDSGPVVADRNSAETT